MIMNILVVSATELEVRFLTDELVFDRVISPMVTRYTYNGIIIDIIITGVGMIFTTFHLTNALVKNEYNLVLNIGLSASFSKKIKIGEVLNVVSEEFADLGVEKYSGFETMFDIGYISKNEFPFENGVIHNNTDGFQLNFPIAKGITVNKANQKKTSVQRLSSKFDTEVESMEGAAVFYVCKYMEIPFLELRSVSNYVGSNEFSDWDIPLALEKLNDAVFQVLQKINVVVG